VWQNASTTALRQAMHLTVHDRPESFLAAAGLFLRRAEAENSVRHVVGPPTACEAFARTWLERTGQDHALRYRLRHLELARSPRRLAASGRMRELRADEHDLILDWQAAFIVEVGMPDDPESVRKKTLRRLEQGGFRVWDDDGVVAFAGYGSGGDTARMAPVYTPPRFRCRGYASALVAEISRELLEGGKRALFLTTDVASPTSNSIYQRIGYRPVAEHVHLALLAATT